MIRQAGLDAASAAINRALAYDPATKLKLEKLGPKSIRLQLEGKQAATIDMVIDAAAISLTLIDSESGEPEDTPVDVTITSDIAGLSQVLLNRGEKPTNSHFRVEGDVHFLSKLQEIVRGVDIDWEEPLTQIFGDLLGHQLANIVRTQSTRAKHASQSLPEWLNALLTEELQCSPSKHSLNQFYDDVDGLSSHINRLEQRIQKLKRDMGE